MTDVALTALIGSYCRENGVRNLQKHIEKVTSNDNWQCLQVVNLSLGDFFISFGPLNRTFVRSFPLFPVSLVDFRL